MGNNTINSDLKPSKKHDGGWLKQLKPNNQVDKMVFSVDNIYLSIYLPTYLSIYLSIYLYIYLPTYLSIYLPIYLSNHINDGTPPEVSYPGRGRRMKDPLNSAALAVKPGGGGIFLDRKMLTDIISHNINII